MDDFRKGNVDRIPSRIREILFYIKKHALKLKDNFLQKCIFNSF